MESTERSIVPRRVAGVTAALAGTGAVLGAGLSAGLVALGAFGMRTAALAVPGGAVLTAAGMGAVLGAVLTPLTALSLLRQVALGKSLLFTVIGMSVGLSAGHLATAQPLPAVGAGVAGFLLTALVLRFRASAPRTQGK